MKNVVLVLCVAFLAKSAVAAERGNRLSLEEKQQVAEALQLLLISGALSTDDGKDLKIRSDILVELEQEGLLDRRASWTQAICVEPVPQ